MPIKSSTLEKQLCKIIDEGVPKTKTIDSKRYYISKKLLKENKKSRKKKGVSFH